MVIFIDTSVDNMLAAFGLGALAPNYIGRTTVFSTFVTAEAAAAISGELLRNTWLGHSAHLLAPAVLPLYILCAALFLIRGTATSGVGPIGAAGVALLFSLDNFIAAASGQTDFSLLKSVLLPAAISGITALLALEAGKFLSTGLRRVLEEIRRRGSELAALAYYSLRVFGQVESTGIVLESLSSDPKS